jgi:hypothetical protein
MVSAAVVAVVPLKVRGLVAPKLSVGRSDAPDGLLVMAAVSVMLPVKPPAGVNVMVEVFPVVAPGERETAEPVTVKLGAAVGVAFASFENALVPVAFTPLTT